MSNPQKQSFYARFIASSPAHSFFEGLVEPHPGVEEIGARRQAQLLSILTLALSVTLALSALISLIASLVRGTPDYTTALLLAVITALTGVPYMLSRTEDYRIGITMIVGALSAASFALIFMQGTASVSAVYTFIPAAFVLGSVLLSIRGMLVLVAADAVGVLIVPLSMPNPNMADILTAVVNVAVLGALLIITMAFRDAIERQRIAIVTNANTELKTLREALELRVAERTLALETSTEISRRLSTILDQKELVTTVVEEVKRAFGYYHAHIYLFDQARQNLEMVGGTGEAGEILLARGHKIPSGKGLVGRAASSHETVLVADTRSDPSWLPNPLLPETRSEIAVPIASGELVLGVLDVQQNAVNGLTLQDADLLKSIANQVAVAVQNARLFTSAQERAGQEAMVNLVSQRIQNAATVEDVLKIAVRELGNALGTQRARIEVGRFSKSGD